ncbi:hypothetical protein EOM82_01090 [bacterium]|nr:hypothetical protein [bacterium]
MNTKTIALWGVSNSGKTKTLTTLFDMLEREEIETILKCKKGDSEDFYAVIKYKGKVIGFTTHGDNRAVLIEPFEVFSNYSCNIVICASRIRHTEKGSVSFIEETFGKDNILWFRQPNFALPNGYKDTPYYKQQFIRINSIVAESLLNEVNKNTE